MLFKFNKYIYPLWYFNISSEKSANNLFLIDFSSLSPSQLQLIDIDEHYNTVEATKCDAAFQILQKGIFSTNPIALKIEPAKVVNTKLQLSTGKNITIAREEYILDLKDNYRFVRRFWGSIHALEILGMRLLSFHNPIKEISAYMATRKVKRVALYKDNGYAEYKEKYERFDSKLVTANPMISVIIPTLNRYEYLKDVLKDLENQDYNNFEVIVVDQTTPFEEAFYNGWTLDLKVYQQQEKALWQARNQAVKRAAGEYILLYDDDSRVGSDWIRQHLKCLDYFKCDISSGASLSTVGAKIPADYVFFKWSAQLDTGNVMFAKSMMRDIGMFDRQFEKQRMGDGEYGLRAYLNGKTNISNPYAKRIHLKVASGGLRQMGAWDAFQNKKIFAPRPIPSILYLCRKYFGDNTAKALLAFSIPFSLLPYKYKGSNKMKVVSLLLFIILFPIVLVQVIKSWKQASLKLKEGAKIDIL